MRYFLIFGFFVFSSCAKKNSTSSMVDSGFFPVINYSVPDPASTTQQKTQANRTTTSGSNVLSEWASKMNRIVDFVNELFTSLNRTNISINFSGSHQLENGNTISLSVAERTGDPSYTQHALLCNNGVKFLYAKWNSDHTKINVIRDFSQNPQITNTNFNRTMMAEVEYSKDISTNEATIHFYGNGEPWYVPSDVTQDGTFLVDHIASVKHSDDSFTVSGVNSWTNTPIDSSYSGDTNGDVWMVGQMNADGSGSFIAHRKYNSTICNSAFTELSPNWCFGASLNSSGIPDYSILNLSNLWVALETIGLTDDNTLKYIEMPSTLECPL